MFLLEHSTSAILNVILKKTIESKFIYHVNLKRNNQMLIGQMSLAFH